MTTKKYIKISFNRFPLLGSLKCKILSLIKILSGFQSLSDQTIIWNSQLSLLSFSPSSKACKQLHQARRSEIERALRMDSNYQGSKRFTLVCIGSDCVFLSEIVSNRVKGEQRATWTCALDYNSANALETARELTLNSWMYQEIEVSVVKKGMSKDRVCSQNQEVSSSLSARDSLSFKLSDREETL